MNIPRRSFLKALAALPAAVAVASFPKVVQALATEQPTIEVAQKTISGSGDILFEFDDFSFYVESFTLQTEHLTELLGNSYNSLLRTSLLSAHINSVGSRFITSNRLLYNLELSNVNIFSTKHSKIQIARLDNCYVKQVQLIGQFDGSSGADLTLAFQTATYLGDDDERNS